MEDKSDYILIFSYVDTVKLSAKNRSLNSIQLINQELNSCDLKETYKITAFSKTNGISVNYIRMKYGYKAGDSVFIVRGMSKDDYDCLVVHFGLSGINCIFKPFSAEDLYNEAKNTFKYVLPEIHKRQRSIDLFQLVNNIKPSDIKKMSEEKIREFSETMIEYKNHEPCLTSRYSISPTREELVKIVKPLCNGIMNIQYSSDFQNLCIELSKMFPQEGSEDE